jgi:hypothetical protein
MITETAKRKLALYLKEFFTEANVGVGGNASNPNMTDLDVPILTSKKTTTNSESTQNVIDFTATFTGSELDGNTVREFGIFSSTSPADDQFDELRTTTSYTAENIMLARVNFDALGTFSSSDELEITLTVEVE